MRSAHVVVFNSSGELLKTFTKAPGKSCAEQVIGTNVDMVVVVTDADSDYNIRRIERYLTLIRKCGAKPVVLINKADIVPEEQMQQACNEVAALGVEVYPIVAHWKKGYPKYLRRVPKGTTITVVGSSGVGKSTFVNSLLKQLIQHQRST